MLGVLVIDAVLDQADRQVAKRQAVRDAAKVAQVGASTIRTPVKHDVDLHTTASLAGMVFDHTTNDQIRRVSMSIDLDNDGRQHQGDLVRLADNSEVGPDPTIGSDDLSLTRVTDLKTGDPSPVRSGRRSGLTREKSPEVVPQDWIDEHDLVQDEEQGQHAEQDERCSGEITSMERYRV